MILFPKKIDEIRDRAPSFGCQNQRHRLDTALTSVIVQDAVLSLGALQRDSGVVLLNGPPPKFRLKNNKCMIPNWKMKLSK